MLTVELSGVGHYGVCTVVPSRTKLSKCLGRVRKLLKINREDPDEWVLPSGGPGYPARMGRKEAFRIISTNETKRLPVKLAWSPYNIRSAMVSHNDLMQIEAVSFKQGDSYMCPVENSLRLRVWGDHDGSGIWNWRLGASFGSDIWDVIEGSDFPAILPYINADIRALLEDQGNGFSYKQDTVTLVDGRQGKTLTFSQPSGGQGAFSGTREMNASAFQIGNEDTQHAQGCFQQVFALCKVLEHCRAALATKK